MCFAFIEEARSSGGSVMVHCLAGVSRTGAVIISYLMHSLGYVVALQSRILVCLALLFTFCATWHAEEQCACSHCSSDHITQRAHPSCALTGLQWNMHYFWAGESDRSFSPMTVFWRNWYILNRSASPSPPLDVWSLCTSSLTPFTWHAHANSHLHLPYRSSVCGGWCL